ncbi:hypothetical protein EPO34_03805 [Patescibacteria group bacterium]|nr:MAG: hypothetical protein EPO34_03805 [Patescibacteria group bacterium]
MKTQQINPKTIVEFPVVSLSANDRKKAQAKGQIPNDVDIKDLQAIKTLKAKIPYGELSHTNKSHYAQLRKNTKGTTAKAPPELAWAGGKLVTQGYQPCGVDCTGYRGDGYNAVLAALKACDSIEAFANVLIDPVRTHSSPEGKMPAVEIVVIDGYRENFKNVKATFKGEFSGGIIRKAQGRSEMEQIGGINFMVVTPDGLQAISASKFLSEYAEQGGVVWNFLSFLMAQAITLGKLNPKLGTQQFDFIGLDDERATFMLKNAKPVGSPVQSAFPKAKTTDHAVTSRGIGELVPGTKLVKSIGWDGLYAAAKSGNNPDYVDQNLPFNVDGFGTSTRLHNGQEVILATPSEGQNLAVSLPVTATERGFALGAPQNALPNNEQTKHLKGCVAIRSDEGGMTWQLTRQSNDRTVHDVLRQPRQNMTPTELAFSKATAGEQQHAA